MKTSDHRSMTIAESPVDPFVDPVGYLRGLGIEAYLVEIKQADLPSAA